MAIGGSGRGTTCTEGGTSRCDAAMEGWIGDGGNKDDGAGGAGESAMSTTDV
jgi:hypothetical protein